MSEQWQLNRAGLVNFWYYDEEIFNFEDGKLLLRGANGSGKSVTMQSFLPVLLDGKKSPDRLDPFGSKARRMEDYLLGEKEVVNRDERTGYLFIEYVKKSTGQYMTTGIGMQAKRNKQMKSWYFVITDNRRIGVDLHLTQEHTGEKIPLSEKELMNRIETGGHVVNSQKEYMELVNRYVFGFQTIDAYEDLIKLLIQLRSPKLSKDFKPTVIYDILSSALPPLTDDEIRYLSDTIDHMDQAEQQLAKLEQDKQAMHRLVKAYDRYNRYVLAEKADRWRNAAVKKERTSADVLSHNQAINEAEQELEHLEREKKELGIKEESLNQDRERLNQHKVWDLEKQKTELVNELQKREASYQQLEQKRDNKYQAYVSKQKERESNEIEEAKQEGYREDYLKDMEEQVDECDFPSHKVNLVDLERMTIEKYDFSVWKQEVRRHQGKLEEIKNLLEEQSQKQTRFHELERESSEMKQKVDYTLQEIKNTEQFFSEEQQELEDVVFTWIADHAILDYPHSERQELARGIQGLYEETTMDDVKDILRQGIDRYREFIQQKKANTETVLHHVQDCLTNKQQQLTDLKQQKMIEPDRAEGTVQHRRLLLEENITSIPFYEAVEFRASVDEKTKSRLESALRRTGILDSLITDRHIVPQEDAALVPQPLVMVHTLADYLVPDVEDDISISKEQVDNVLRSIPLDQTEGAFQIDTDGSFKLGILQGHAPVEGPAKFIGRSSRKRYLQERMRLLSEEITQLEEEKDKTHDELLQLEEQLIEIRNWYQSIPSDKDLRVLQKNKEDLETARGFQQDQLDKIDAKWKQIQLELHVLKQNLYHHSGHFSFQLNLENINNALYVLKEYDDNLQQLHLTEVKLQAIRRKSADLSNALNELQEEVDMLRGDMNVEEDEIEKRNHSIQSIEKQLTLQNVEEVRAEIQRVLNDLASTKTKLNEVIGQFTGGEVRLETMRETLLKAEEEALFWNRMEYAYRELVLAELQQPFLDVDEEENADAILSRYGEILETSEKAKILEQLTKAIGEEGTALSEYRLLHFTEEKTLPEWMLETDRESGSGVFIKEYESMKDRRFIRLHYNGSPVNPYYASEEIRRTYEEQERYLDDQDRKLYEDIIVNHIGTILRSRIRRAANWVKKMDQIMLSRDNSSGLVFSIAWKPQTAETEEEIDTAELVRLLQRDSKYLSEEDLTKITRHFQSRIARAKELIQMQNQGTTLHQVLKEVLDYRKWFTFVLSYKHENEAQKRELTNNAFYRFSGGEKAMAMYIPLFTAAYSRYQEAGDAAPYIISLDEAFAGVDENNIRDTFEVVEQLGFNYIMNSQALWGDYDTVPALAIAELLRPKNADFVTVMRYTWDGVQRKQVPVILLEEEESNEQYEFT